MMRRISGPVGLILRNAICGRAAPTGVFFEPQAGHILPEPVFFGRWLKNEQSADTKISVCLIERDSINPRPNKIRPFGPGSGGAFFL